MDLNQIANAMLTAAGEIGDEIMECTFDILAHGLVELVCQNETGHSILVLFSVLTEKLVALPGFSI